MRCGLLAHSVQLIYDITCQFLAPGCVRQEDYIEKLQDKIRRLKVKVKQEKRSDSADARRVLFKDQESSIVERLQAELEVCVVYISAVEVGRRNAELALQVHLYISGTTIKAYTLLKRIAVFDKRLTPVRHNSVKLPIH